MRQKFSPHWKSSRQKRKKRKYKANAPLHLKRKFLSANLSKELRKKYNKRSVVLRKGDNVKIMRGNFKGKSGKVDVVDIKKMRLTIEGIKKQKKDGSKINVYFNASNMQIKELNLDDKRRAEIFSQKKQEEIKSAK